MIVRIAVFLIAVWAALFFLRILVHAAVHLLVLAAVILLIVKLVDLARKSTA